MLNIEVDCWPLNESLELLRQKAQHFTHSEERVFLIDPGIYGSLPITRWTLEVEDFFAAQVQFASADAVRIKNPT